jgi:hypothetical protein
MSGDPLFLFLGFQTRQQGIVVVTQEVVDAGYSI